MRPCESVSARFQVPAVKVAVAVLVDGHKGVLRIVETALNAEKAAELDLPRDLHKSMTFEGVAQSEIRGAAIECCAVVELSGLWDEISVAGEERAVGISLAGTGGGSRIGNDWRDTTKAVGGESVSTADGASAEIRAERVVVFRDVGVAPAQGETTAHSLFEGKDSTVIGAAIPRSEAIHLCGPAAAIIDARGKGKICLANAEDVHNVFVVVVDAEDPIIADLALNAEGIATSVGRGKARIDGYGEIAGLEDIE